jgi:hypothetical protein
MYGGIESIMEDQSQDKIPFFVSLDMIKEAMKALPIEEIQALKQIIDEIIEEYEKEKAR